MIPVLETPKGELIPESDVVAEYARTFANGQGEKLYPGDGEEDSQKYEAEVQQQKDLSAKFDSMMGAFWGAFLSRFKDEEKCQAYEQKLPEFEKFIADILGGKETYLSQTDVPMQIDYNIYPFLAMLVLLENSPWSYAFERFKVKEVAPTIYAYVHRFRAGPRGSACTKQEQYNAWLQYWTDHSPDKKPMLSLDFI